MSLNNTWFSAYSIAFLVAMSQLLATQISPPWHIEGKFIFALIIIGNKSSFITCSNKWDVFWEANCGSCDPEIFRFSCIQVIPAYHWTVPKAKQLRTYLYWLLILGALFKRFRKNAKNHFTSSYLCVSVCTETVVLEMGEYSWKLIFEVFSKICQENASLIKLWVE